MTLTMAFCARNDPLALTMTYRILRIRGRNEAARRARLEAAQRWMSTRGWKLVDYAESTRQAMFEPDSDSFAPATVPWSGPPGSWRGLLEEWTTPRRLAITLVPLLVLAALFIFNARHSKFDPADAAADADERWWTITADRVNVRERPAPNAPVVAMLHKGQRVLVTNRKAGWAEVTQPERGFLSLEFLQRPQDRK